MKTFIEYIKSNNYEFDIDKSIYMDIWFPLLKKKHILINNDILYFIFDKIDKSNLKNFKKIVKKTLKKYNISYKKITYKNILSNKLFLNDIKNDIKELNTNQLNKKTWILLTNTNFKNLILKSNTITSKKFIKYYFTLENIIFNYFIYYGSKINNNKLKE